MRGLATITLWGSLVVVALVGCDKSKSEASSGAQPAASVVASSAPALKGAEAGGPLKTCAECEAATACTELKDPCQKLGADDAKQCEAVKECVLRTGCGQAEHTFTSCYCGDLRTADCIAAPIDGAKAPAGACRDVLSKSFGSYATNTELLTRFLEPEYAGGAALARLNCLKLNCQRECSFDKPGPVVASAATPK